MKHIFDFMVRVFSQVDDWGKKGQALAFTFFFFLLVMATLWMAKYLEII